MQKPIPQTRYCPDCGRERPIEDFGRVYRNQDRPRQGYCRKHDYDRVRESEQRRRRNGNNNP